MRKNRFLLFLVGLVLLVIFIYAIMISLFWSRKGRLNRSKRVYREKSYFDRATFTRYLLIFSWIITNSLVIVFIYRDLEWSLQHNISLLKFLHHFTNLYLAFYVFALYFLPLRKRLRFLNWRVFLWPSLIVSVLIPLECYPSPYLLVFGHVWLWSSALTWLLLFNLQLILYQTRGVSELKSFLLSLAGLLLSGTLYEIPHFIARGVLLDYLVEFRFSLSLLLLAFFIYQQKPSMAKLTLLLCSAIPLFLMLPFYYALTYFPRFFVFPLILTIPLMKKRGE